MHGIQTCSKRNTHYNNGNACTICQRPVKSAQYYKSRVTENGHAYYKTGYTHSQRCMFFTHLFKNKSSHYFCAAGMLQYYAKSSSQNNDQPQRFHNIAKSFFNGINNTGHRHLYTKPHYKAGNEQGKKSMYAILCCKYYYYSN